MFNDRDLAVIGGGAVLSVFCLLLPVSFAWKISFGVIVLVLSMILALTRLGGDRLPVEEWLRRRVRFYFRPRRWVFHEREMPEMPASVPGKTPLGKPQARAEQPRTGISFEKLPLSAPSAAGMLLMLTGLYFLYALWTGEIAQISMVLGGLLR